MEPSSLLLLLILTPNSSRWRLPRTSSKPHSCWDSRVLLSLISGDHPWLLHPAKEISRTLAAKDWWFSKLLPASYPVCSGSFLLFLTPVCLPQGHVLGAFQWAHVCQASLLVDRAQRIGFFPLSSKQVFLILGNAISPP